MCKTWVLVAESLLYLSNGFSSGVAKLFAKFVVLSLLTFHHFTTYWNLTSAHYTVTEGQTASSWRFLRA